jgi:glycosyltransferase involved in cell wall biosynthesis
MRPTYSRLADGGAGLPVVANLFLGGIHGRVGCRPIRRIEMSSIPTAEPAIEAVVAAARTRTPSSARAERSRRITVLMPDLNGGGVQKMTLALAAALSDHGHEVDIVVCQPSGVLEPMVPPQLRVRHLASGSMLRGRLLALKADPGALPHLLLPVLLARKPARTLVCLEALAAYLRERRPDALLAATPHQNLQAIWAKHLARVSTRVLVSERTAPSQVLPLSPLWRRRFLPPLMLRAYQQADVIVSVSQRLGDDLAEVTGIPRERITAIYNPVVGPEIEVLAAEPVDHPWFAPGEPPVILGMGRLSEQKDFPTLIRAFARVRARRRIRLVIFGAARDPEKTEQRRGEIKALARQLKVGEDVDAPGFTPNPFAYMALAALFVLSSRYEGLPGVLIQALASGCPVVSTDCPSGPMEILDNGRWGPLVPVGDDAAIAAAIEQVLDDPLPAAALKARAREFSVDRAVQRYLEVLFGGADRT